MNETLRVMILIFVVSAAIVMACYLFYRWIRKHWSTIVLLMRDVLGGGDASVNDWDGGELWYRVLGGTLRFLIAEYIVLSLAIGLTVDGWNGLNYELFFSLLYAVDSAMESLLGIVGMIGVMCGTIYGVHQDLQSHRLAALAGLGICGILIGLGIRFD